MVKYILIEENEDTVSYRYFPEGHEDFGSITMDKKTADLVSVDVAKTDKFKWYFYHMVEQIEEFIKNNNFLNDGYVAWY